jgi:hypothetical protein
VKRVSSILLASLALYADVPLGIIGGTSGAETAYGAFVFSTGDVLSLPLDEPLSYLNALSINSKGLGLIGGQEGGDPYAAFAISDGTLTPLSLGLSGGEILSTDINRNGEGLLGGYSSGGYAAFITADGVIRSVSFSTAGIASVSLNDAGIGLIGGQSDSGTMVYAAYVDSSGMATEITGTPTGDTGNIYGVSLNDLGNGLIGGRFISSPYAAFVTEASVSTAISLPGGSGSTP